MSPVERFTCGTRTAGVYTCVLIAFRNICRSRQQILSPEQPLCLADDQTFACSLDDVESHLRCFVHLQDPLDLSQESIQ